MATYLDGELREATESWDRLLRQLSAAPRRRILLALLRRSADESVPLPEAAILPDESVDHSRYAISLRHHHLPSLAETGYVTWSSQPLQARRGPRFEEAAAIIRVLIENQDELPRSLWNDAVERNLSP